MRMRRGIRFSQFMLLNEELIWGALFLKVTCLIAFRLNFFFGIEGFMGDADGRRQKANRIIFNTRGKQVVLYNVIIVVYKINCMQKRLNLATHYELRAKTPHPTLQNTPFTLSLSLLFLLSISVRAEKVHHSSLVVVLAD